MGLAAKKMEDTTFSLTEEFCVKNEWSASWPPMLKFIVGTPNSNSVQDVASMFEELQRITLLLTNTEELNVKLSIKVNFPLFSAFSRSPELQGLSCIVYLIVSINFLILKRLCLLFGDPTSQEIMAHWFNQYNIELFLTLYDVVLFYVNRKTFNFV